MTDISELATRPASATRPRQQERRRATENAIIDAFERLLNRTGVAGLGVNALVKEAGVGKKQVYDYFGGLAGVAEAWVKTRAVWTPIRDLIPEPLEQFEARRPIERHIMVYRIYLQSLRGNPSLCELLTGEVMKDHDVQDAVDHVRQLIRQDFESLRSNDPRMDEPDMMALTTVAYAAATYIGMRAHNQPHFLGFDLSQDMSWATVLRMFERVMTLADPERCEQQDRPVNDNSPRSGR